MNSVVRYGLPSDEEAIFDLYVAIHREIIGQIIPYSYERMMAGIQKGTRRQGAFIGVIDAPNQTQRLAGMVFLYLDQWWFSDYAFLNLRECYVRPQYRKGTGYFELLREFAENIRKYADDTKPEGHPPVLLEASFVNSLLTGDPRRLRLMERLWRRWGRHVGGVYVSGL